MYRALSQSHLSLSSLQSLRISLDECPFVHFPQEYLSPYRQRACGRLAGLAWNGAAIWHVSTHLRILEISGSVFFTPDMFWPTPFDDAGDDSPRSGVVAGNPGIDTDATFWPHLEKFKMNIQLSWYHMFAPQFWRYSESQSQRHKDYYSGLDYLTGRYCFISTATLHALAVKPAYDAGDEHWAEFNGIAVAMSRALLCMPKMKETAIRTSDWSEPRPNGAPPFLYKKEMAAQVPYMRAENDRTTRDGMTPVKGIHSGETYPPLCNFISQNPEWVVPEEMVENWRELCQRVRHEDLFHDSSSFSPVQRLAGSLGQNQPEGV